MKISGETPTLGETKYIQTNALHSCQILISRQANNLPHSSVSSIGKKFLCYKLMIPVLKTFAGKL